MAVTAAMGSMVGLIPITVAGGLVLKFAEAGLPPRRGRSRRVARRISSRRRGSRYQGLPGNYSNVGF